MWYLYILYSEKRDCYYVGSTNDVERRVTSITLSKPRLREVEFCGSWFTPKNIQRNKKHAIVNGR